MIIDHVDSAIISRTIWTVTFYSSQVKSSNPNRKYKLDYLTQSYRNFHQICIFLKTFNGIVYLLYIYFLKLLKVLDNIHKYE